MFFQQPAVESAVRVERYTVDNLFTNLVISNGILSIGDVGWDS